MSNLEGKVALVTGGNSGIGYATARELKDKGAKVFITGRDKERVEKSASELGVTGIVADVLDNKALDKMIEKVQKSSTHIDILFINAGVFFGVPIGQNSEELFDMQMGINFKGAVFTLEKSLPLLKTGSSIISLSTALASAGFGMANTSLYSASKAALDSYMRVAVTELAPRGIRVNTISPGPINTPIFGKTGMTENQIQEFATAMQNRVPLKKFGTPEDVAKLVSFHGSDDSSFINGANITIDGGIVINPGLFSQ